MNSTNMVRLTNKSPNILKIYDCSTVECYARKIDVIFIYDGIWWQLIIWSSYYVWGYDNVYRE